MLRLVRTGWRKPENVVELAPQVKDLFLELHNFPGGQIWNPHPALRRLRERDPVNETPVGIWRLTRYADVDRLLHRVPCGVRTTDGILPGVDEALSGQRMFMLQQDPPTHPRLRRLVTERLPR